jgi:hypothetical protein
MTPQTIDGFEVRCVVVKQDGSLFQVGISTRRTEDSEDPRTWNIPGERYFASPEEALRYGRYVLLGISNVARDGKPLFTVV